MKIFYETLAPWWPLISPFEDYAQENHELVKLINTGAPKRPHRA